MGKVYVHAYVHLLPDSLFRERLFSSQHGEYEEGKTHMDLSPVGQPRVNSCCYSIGGETEIR